MNYKKHYANLIKKAKRRENLEGYSELHHIRPKCLGGLDTKKNLVRLTSREHFVAHILLTKMYPQHTTLIKAVNMMCAVGNKQLRTNNRMYGWLRQKFAKEMSKSQTGEANSQYNTIWITNGILNKKISKEAIVPSGYDYGRINTQRKGKPLKILNQSDYGRKLIKDLGVDEKGTRRATLECVLCQRQDTVNILTLKNKLGTTCRSCSAKNKN